MFWYDSSKNKHCQLPFYTDHSTALDKPFVEMDSENKVAVAWNQSGNSVICCKRDDDQRSVRQ